MTVIRNYHVIACRNSLVRQRCLGRLAIALPPHGFLIDYTSVAVLFSNSRKDIMPDSPATHIPNDPEEQPILESILRIRDNLQLLKEDKSTYVKSQDVLSLYDQVIEQVNLLNVIREKRGKPLEQSRGPLNTSNRNDRPKPIASQLTYHYSGQGFGRLFSTYIAVFPYHRTQQ